MKSKISKIVTLFLFAIMVLFSSLYGEKNVYAEYEVQSNNYDADTEYIYIMTICVGDDVYREGINCHMVANGSNLEYKWFVQDDRDKSWMQLSDWRSNTELYWQPEKYGTYVITCMVREQNNANTMRYKSIRYTYCPKLKGICQMPNTQGDGGFLIGLESEDNDNYSYEMLILDVELYEQGKDAWIYTTGKCKSDQNCMWTIWQPKVGVYWTLFRIFNAQDEIIDERCFGFINTEESSYPVYHEKQPDICPSFGNDDTDVRNYSYEIIPLLKPFDYYYYVKTDNPHPEYIRFVDKQSKYYTEEQRKETNPCSIRYEPQRFSDVVYEDYDNFRVKGGYIFVRDSGYGMDGGELSLQQADKAYKVESSYRTEPNYSDTGITVNCPEVIPEANYLINNYTSSNKSLFENLSSVQSALYNLSIYPREVLDTTKINSNRPYPFLATSPYADMSLNPHYDIFGVGDAFLAENVQPFMLTSLTFPGVIGRVAKILEPSCEISAGSIHSRINITFNGETQSFGGAGRGNYGHIYSKYIEKLYTFDNSINDFTYNATIEKINDKYFDYVSKTQSDLQQYQAMISSDQINKKIGNGNWLRTAREGMLGYGTSYSYALKINEYTMVYPKNVWVDGRYINIYSRYDEGTRFGDVKDYNTVTDTSKSGIIVRNMTYVDYYGNTVTNDVLFDYSPQNDDWRATISYTHGYSYQSNIELPDYMILNREEVEQMRLNGEIDGKTDKLPESGLIYDGTVEPGTAFAN